MDGDRDVIKTSTKLRVNRGKVWEWEHKNWLEERDLEVLRNNKDETAQDWLDLALS